MGVCSVGFKQVKTIYFSLIISTCITPLFFANCPKQCLSSGFQNNEFVVQINLVFNMVLLYLSKYEILYLKSKINKGKYTDRVNPFLLNFYPERYMLF